MNINKRARILVGAVALAGSVAFAGNAFTAGGVTVNPGAGDNDGSFLGGNLTQAVWGAVITNVAYETDTSSPAKIDSVTITFESDTPAADKPVTLKFYNGADALQGSYTCEAVGDTNADESVCEPTEANPANRAVTTSVAKVVINVDSSTPAAS